jgi:bidirectional [NiFe] hydrogenase diaphorase subunit
MARLFINDTEITAKAGRNLLWTALDYGFYIPNLCSLRYCEHPIASCRLCFVEIDGRNHPVTACTESIADGVRINLDTEHVRRIRNTSFELLMSHHRLNCGKCDKNRHCELQNIASKLHLKMNPSRLRQIPDTLPVDFSHELFYYDPNKCVLCGKCIYICRKKGGGILDFAFRGIKARVSTFFDSSLVSQCGSCTACVTVCPVGSLGFKKQ